MTSPFSNPPSRVSNGAGAARLAAARQETQEVATVARQVRQVAQKQDAASDIATNPFFQILIDGDVSENERKRVFAEYMTSTLDIAKDRARIEEYKQFRAYLSSVITQLAKQVVQSTATDSFANLQSVIETLSTEYLGVVGAIDPLMDVVNSIRYLTENDRLIDTFSEIDQDRAEEESRILALQKLEEERIQAEEERRRLQDENSALQQKRGFFGFGGVPEAVRMEIARNENVISRLGDDLDSIHAKKDNLSTPKPPKVGDDAEYETHKARLRDLLNLTEGETIQQMTNARDRALQYIESSEQKSRVISGEYARVMNQVNLSSDNNAKMAGISAIMVEGMKEAAIKNVTLREEVHTEAQNAGDDVLVKHRADEKLRVVDEHMKHLHSAQSATMQTFTDLTEQRISIGTVKDTVQTNLENAERQSSQGVASMANGISTVMSVVTNAAVGQSLDVFGNITGHMNDRTRSLVKDEIMRNANYTGKINNELMNIIDSLESFAEVKRISSEITESGLRNMNSNLQELNEMNKDLREKVRESEAVFSKLAAAGDEQVVSSGSATGTSKANNFFSV